MLPPPLPLLAALLLLTTALLATAGPAHACSFEQEMWDRTVREAPLIVEGWVESLVLRQDLWFPVPPKSDPPVLGPHIPVELTLRVERTISGTTSDHLRFIDAASVIPGVDGSPGRHPDGTLEFAGRAGACGILDEDVTGRYGLFILTHREDGSLRPNRLADILSRKTNSLSGELHEGTR